MYGSVGSRREENIKIGVFTYAAWLIFPDGEVKTTVPILSCNTGAITQPLTLDLKISYIYLDTL